MTDALIRNKNTVNSSKKYQTPPPHPPMSPSVSSAQSSSMILKNKPPEIITPTITLAALSDIGAYFTSQEEEANKNLNTQSICTNQII